MPILLILLHLTKIAINLGTADAHIRHVARALQQRVILAGVTCKMVLGLLAPLAAIAEPRMLRAVLASKQAASLAHVTPNQRHLLFKV